MEPRDLSANETYRAGRGIEEVARELDRDPDDLVTLSSNENPLGPSPAAVAAIRDRADRVHVYPKAAHVDLTEAIADYWGLDPAQVWLAAGADGALDYLARAMLDPGDTVLVPRPGFAYYPMSARYHHGRVRAYELAADADFAMTPETVLEPYERDRIVYLTSPHNPTGARASRESIAAIAHRTDDRTLLVVDEAYGEFSDAPSAISLVDDRDDIAVTRTFSKAYGLAGLRLGYAIVPETWADAYAKVNTPFAASEIACRAGLAAIEDTGHLDRSVEVARSARTYMTRHIDARTWESHGNFVLVDVGDADRVSGALERRGVIVRNCASFGLPACVRITAGTEAQTTRAVDALNAVL